MAAKVTQRALGTLGLVLLLFVSTSNPARTELDFGFGAEYQDDYERALLELQPLAEGGDPQAQLWLGLMYYYGWGVTFNPRKAADWIGKSAAQLYPDGEFALCFIMQGCFSGGSPTTN